MASIKKRPDGQWRARYRDPNGKEHAKHFGRKTDAQRWLDEQTSAKVRGEWVDPKLGRVTVGEWADQWLATKGNLKASTRDRYTIAVETHIRPAWGNTRLADVTHADVQSWVSALGGSPASVTKTHRVLSMILALAVKDGRLPRNPAEGVTLPRVSGAEKRYLSHDQAADLADAASPAWDVATRRPIGQGRLVVLVLAYTGMRWGELAALKVSRLDLLRRRLHVAENVVELNDGTLDWGLPKSHERRWVPVPRFLVDELAAHIEGKEPDGLVFAGKGGAVLRNGNARRAWFDAAVELAEVPDGLTPHELRHTAASLAVSAGANVKAVQRMLGHAKASMTLDVYADLFDDDLEAVAERLDEHRQSAETRRLADSARTSGKLADLDAARASR